MKLSMSICLSDKDPITAYTQQLNLFRNSPREDVVVYRLLKFFTHILWTYVPVGISEVTTWFIVFTLDFYTSLIVQYILEAVP